MQVFFQGEPHARHKVLPFVAVNRTGEWGVWYSDDRQGCSYGPFYGRRSNDILASWRGLQLFDAFLARSEQCTADLARACWDLAYDGKATGPGVDQIRAVLGEQITGILGQQVAPMDDALMHAVENDLPISMLGLYEALRAGKISQTPLLEGCCNAALLMVHGQLVPEYFYALNAVRGGRSGGSEKNIREYIERADAMFSKQLTTLERGFNKINHMLPGTEAAAASVKQEGGLLQTITARFRRSDVLSPAATQVAELRKEIGMERIACGEAITTIKQNFSNPHPYADMKLPNYHKSLTRLAQGLLSFSEKLADYTFSHKLANDVEAQTNEVRRNLDELRIWLNLTISDEMPGVYVLRLAPR